MANQSCAKCITLRNGTVSAAGHVGAGRRARFAAPTRLQSASCGASRRRTPERKRSTAAPTRSSISRGLSSRPKLAARKQLSSVRSQNCSAAVSNSVTRRAVLQDRRDGSNSRLSQRAIDPLSELRATLRLERDQPMDWQEFLHQCRPDQVAGDVVYKTVLYRRE
jgi:hypothetical protein